MSRWGSRARARRLAVRGARILHVDRAAAEAAYLEAVSLDPALHEAWFDLGLIYKWTKRWEDAFDANLRAAELVGERREEPAWWNLGIAATALHRWDVARRAWRAYGLTVADGDGPVDANCGYGPVRLNPDGDAEVVWGDRIDPARVRIRSIPFPESGHRCGDIVLHDGAPNGERQMPDGEIVPVFDELMRWQPSDIPTVEAHVTADSPGDVDQLLTDLDTAGLTAEDWTRNVRWLCRQCSEGLPHPDHHETENQPSSRHVVGIAAPLPDATRVVTTWSSTPGRTCHDLVAR